MALKNRIILFFASGWYCGFSPKAPGTIGSLLALPLCFILSKIDIVSSAIAVILFTVIGTWIAHVAEKILRQTDPGCIVIDEMAGLMVTFFYLPFNLITVCLGFIIFRLLDILKPFPISWIEKNITGGLGIMADDIVAGIFSNILLRAILFFVAV